MLKRSGDLSQVVFEKLAACPKGRVLDVGAGSGELSRRFAEIGHETAACNCMPESEWRHRGMVDYRRCDLAKGIPFPDASFDYVVCLEVIEHLDDPLALCCELRRVLRKDGRLFISTPNILSLRSRVRFLLDGSFVFFNYPPIEWERRDGRPSVHVHPIRLHELEYYLHRAGLEVDTVFTNMQSPGWKLWFPLIWMIRLYARHMINCSRRSDRIPLARIYGQILADDVLYGTHLIVSARVGANGNAYATE